MTDKYHMCCVAHIALPNRAISRARYEARVKNVNTKRTRTNRLWRSKNSITPDNPITSQKGERKNFWRQQFRDPKSKLSSFYFSSVGMTPWNWFILFVIGTFVTRYPFRVFVNSVGGRMEWTHFHAKSGYNEKKRRKTFFNNIGLLRIFS